MAPPVTAAAAAVMVTDDDFVYNCADFDDKSDYNAAAAVDDTEDDVVFLSSRNPSPMRPVAGHLGTRVVVSV
jgi:hypothetical protein